MYTMLCIQYLIYFYVAECAFSNVYMFVAKI